MLRGFQGEIRSWGELSLVVLNQLLLGWVGFAGLCRFCIISLSIILVEIEVEVPFDARGDWEKVIMVQSWRFANWISLAFDLWRYVPLVLYLSIVLPSLVYLCLFCLCFRWCICVAYLIIYLWEFEIFDIFIPELKGRRCMTIGRGEEGTVMWRTMDIASFGVIG